jgi:hypothetical protein
VAYNRKNILTRIVDIQTVTLEHTRRGVSQEFVYNDIIYPRYRISKRTYYRYLKENAKKELKELTL